MPNGPIGIPGHGPIQRFEDREALGFLPRGWIDGLVLSNDTTDATNDIAIAAGSCRSTVNVVNGAASTAIRDQIDLDIPVSIIKQIDVSWAPENYHPGGFPGGGGGSGDRSGGRSASALSNTTWHVFAIGGVGLQSDVLLHDGATVAGVVAALPGGYTAYRRIGSIIRASAALVAFVQQNDTFLLKTVVRDINVTTSGTSAVLRTLTVPVGIQVDAIVDVGMAIANGSAANYALVTSPDQTDSAAAATLYTIGAAEDASTNIFSTARLSVRTNTSAQIRTRESAGSASHTLRINTSGWIDSRWRDA